MYNNNVRVWLHFDQYAVDTDLKVQGEAKLILSEITISLYHREGNSYGIRIYLNKTRDGKNAS